MQSSAAAVAAAVAAAAAAAAAPRTQLRSRHLSNLKRHTQTPPPPRLLPSHSLTKTCFQEACRAAWLAARLGHWQALPPARNVRRRHAARGSLSQTPLGPGLRQALLLLLLLLLPPRVYQSQRHETPSLRPSHWQRLARRWHCQQQRRRLMHAGCTMPSAARPRASRLRMRLLAAAACER